MPDYDPKNIPTLDDVIEEDVASQGDSDDTGQIEQAEPGHTEEAIDITGDTPGDIVGKITEEILDAEAEPEKHPRSPSSPRFSVQITYQEIYDKSSNFGDTEDDTAPQHSTLDSERPEAEDTTITPIELESIVNDVVRQLLPEMENQLRSLLQQALEAQLPETIIRSGNKEASEKG